MRNRRLLVGLALAASMMGGAPAVAAESVTVGTTERAVVLDPAGAYDLGSQQLIGNVFQTLLSVPPGGNRPKPDAARRCAFRGAKTYVCTLRSGLRFSNGDRLTAADVKFSLERAINIADPTGPSTLLYNLRRVDAKGQTVTMHLRRADATWPSLLSHTVGAIVPRRVFPARRLLADRKVIGSGPYRLDRYTPDRRAVLSRNARYSGSAKPKTKTVTVAYFASGAALKTAIEQGAVDVAFRGFSAAEIAALRAQPGVQVLEGPGAEIHYLVFDLAKVPNVLVRQAVAQVVDRSALASAAYAGTVTPLHSMVPAAVPGAKPSFQAIYGAPDAEKARQLLAAAGLTPPVALDAWYTPSRYGPEEQAAMAELRRQLEATGLFTVTLGATQWDAFKEDAFSRHRYSSYALGWFPDVLDADNFLSPFVRDGGFLANGYENATVNRNLDLQLRTTREPARLQIIGELQDAVAHDVPLLPLWERKQIAVVRPGVAGVQESFDASLQLRFSLLSKP